LSFAGWFDKIYAYCTLNVNFYETLLLESMTVHSSSLEYIRILLLDNDALVRAGLTLLLECQPGLKVAAQAGEEGDALRLAEQEQPDIILLHESLNGLMGFDIIPRLAAVTGKSRFILITALSDQQYHVQAVHKGAMGVVMAQQSPDVLYKAIKKVHTGEVWLDRSLIANFLIQKSNGKNAAGVDPQARKIALLSARERDVIRLVGEGLKNQQIADQLFLSEVTVRHHLTSVFKKLGVADRLELVIFAYQNDLAQLPE
jgi:DNA-binding NarL/FixJ family response regulator